MKKDKRILKSASLVAGALLTTSLATAPAMGAGLLDYNDLGTGSTVRTHLIDINSGQQQSQAVNAIKFGELKWLLTARQINFSIY